MANITIPQLSVYQYGLLCHTASASVPIFLLPMPALKDRPSQRYKLQARANEVKSLVAMGLMEDASEEFKDSIADQFEHTGRTFRVYGMTAHGYLLFKNCDDRAAN